MASCFKQDIKRINSKLFLIPKKKSLSVEIIFFFLNGYDLVLLSYFMKSIKDVPT